MRRVAAFIIAFVGMTTSAFAQDGAECFCLEAPSIDGFLWGCLTEPGMDTALCLDFGADGLIASEVSYGDRWKVVSAGDGLCVPCMPDARLSSDLPENFRDLAAKIGEADPAADANPAAGADE